MARSNSGNYVFGSILIAVGSALLVRRYLPFGLEQALLLALGTAFCILGIVRRGYGSLIAGMMLLGVSAGLILGERHALGLDKVHWLMLCLGAGFVAIYLLGLILGLGKRWWPLVPAVLLLGIGGGDRVWRLQFLPESIVHVVEAWWPVVLVIFGVGLLVRAFKK
jgi:hypothetical protein